MGSDNTRLRLKLVERACKALEMKNGGEEEGNGEGCDQITRPPGRRGGLEDGVEVVVPSADEDGAVEVGRHRLAPPHEHVAAVAQVLQHPPHPAAPDDDGRDDGRGGAGGHARRRPDPNPRPGAGTGAAAEGDGYGAIRGRSAQGGCYCCWCGGHWGSAE